MKKLLHKINIFEELLIGYLLVLIAIVATIQVFMRYTFGIAYDWVDEISRYMCILITLVGAGVCARNGSHFCMDALLQYVPRPFKHLLKVLANLISTLTMIVVCYYAWIQIEKLYRFGATTPSLEIPMYVPYLPLGIFTAVIAVRFFIKTVIHTKGLIYNLPYNSDQGRH